MEMYNKPLAASGLNSYRYRGRYGWIMIGAKDEADALIQAKRSLYPHEVAHRECLEVWMPEFRKYGSV